MGDSASDWRICLRPLDGQILASVSRAFGLLLRPAPSRGGTGSWSPGKGDTPRSPGRPRGLPASPTAPWDGLHLPARWRPGREPVSRAVQEWELALRAGGSCLKKIPSPGTRSCRCGIVRRRVGRKVLAPARVVPQKALSPIEQVLETLARASLLPEGRLGLCPVET